METLKFYWLGSPLIELQGRAIKLETRKATALLCFLSLTPGKCYRELLSTMFWPEGSQQKALANLRRTLSSLNASLPGWIEANRETINLKRTETLWVDVEAFQQSHTQYIEHNYLEKDARGACLATLEKIIHLYRGEFLEGLNLTDAPDFDEWQFFQRDGLRQKFGDVLQRLAAGYAERNQWEQSITCARRWVALDRLHEPAQRVLIDLYVRSDQRTAALHQYEEFGRLLKEELDQEPEKETQKLYEQIRGKEEAKRVAAVPESPTSFPLLKTKLYIPAPPASRVVRARLVGRLGEVEQKALTIISAPAGFGKTTLLAEWIAQTSLSVAWLSLDNGDNDSYRFLSYLITALESIQEGIGIEALQLIRSSQLIPLHIILATLINELGKIAEPYVLILDDYQFITERAVHETVAYLLDHIPTTMHIVISTRADPPLQLGRLRAYGRMLELRTEDIRFTPKETVIFLNDIMQLGLSDEDIKSLETRTEGWVVGLKMAALSLKGHENSSQFIKAFSGSHRYVLDYLLEEVLKRQPARIQTFLLETSILEKLSGPLCDAIMSEEWMQAGERSQTILEYLERNNLFLIALDDERKWLRYHHLFADLLLTRLKQNSSHLEGIKHQKAAWWFSANAFPAEAIDHAIAARDFQFAADLIEKFSLPLISHSKIATLKTWIDSLPREIIRDRPRLIIYHAWVLARMGNFDNLENMLEEVENIFNANPLSPDSVELKTYLTQLHAFIANIKGDADLAIKVALNGKTRPEQINNDITNINHLIAFQLGYAYYSKGDLDTAEKIFQSVAISAELAEDIYNTVIAQVELAGIHLVRGNMLLAEQLYRNTKEWLTRKVENPEMLEGILKICHASIYLERNEIQEAKKLALEGIEGALLGYRTNTLAYGYTVLANVLRAQGDLCSAREAVEKAMLQIQNHRTYPRTVKNVWTCRVEQWLAEKQLIAAQEWGQEKLQTLSISTALPFYEELEFITLARILIASEHFQEALDLLNKLASAAEVGGRRGRLIKIWILQALALRGLGEIGESLYVLKQSLVCAHPKGYCRVFLDEGEAIIKLLERLKVSEPGFELASYINRLLEAFVPT